MQGQMTNIISYTAQLPMGMHMAATATQLPTAAAGVSGSLSRTLSELLYRNDEESVPVIMYSLQLLMTCVMCWRLCKISMTG